MTLGDFSNLCLVTLQQNGASFTVGGGGGPQWSSLSSPQYSQGLVEFCINEGYKKAMGDLWDLQLTLLTVTQLSTTTTYKYPILPATGGPYANVSHVGRVFYQPYGLPYTWEYRPGSQLISWAEYQGKYTGQGYLLPYSFGTQPKVATIDPLLQNVYFYPGSARSGDTITVEYQPIPTYNSASPIAASAGGILVNQTDTPLLPPDTHMAIFYYAMWLLWARAREMQAMELYQKMYVAELAAVRMRYTLKHGGDTMRVEPFGDPLTLGTFT